MRTVIPTMMVLALLSGCTSRPPHVALERDPITLDSLAVEVKGAPRSFFLSDKAGGFLIGRIPDEVAGGMWSVNGESVFTGVSVDKGGADLRQASRSTTVYPTKVVSTLANGWVVRSSIESLSDAPIQVHVLRIDVRASDRDGVVLTPQLDSDWKTATVKASRGRRWENHRAGLVVQEYMVDRKGESTHPDSATAWSFSTLFVLSTSGKSVPDSTLLMASTEALQIRERDLLATLNSLFIRTGDARLNRAAWWTKATLDGLIIRRPALSIVSSLPWNGTYSGRAIARSFAGLGLTEPDPLVVGSLIRWLADTQQKNTAQSTYGRIASTFSSRTREYTGADIAPDFARNAYDYITSSRDTSMIEELYGVLQRSIAGTMKYHADTLGFLVHGDSETWMDGSSERGNRAVEIQSSWYYQQLVGSFVAEWVKDSLARRQWAQGAARTIAHFNKLFVDSVNNDLFDHITPDGKGISEHRPNALYCLDLLHSEDLQQNIISMTMQHNVYHRGVGTLSPDDPRFTATITSPHDANAFNGPLWSWLSAQVVYSLTRYDRQDLAYIISSHLIKHILDVGMVGGLPGTLAVGPVTADAAEQGSDQCSVDAEAEFLRGIYQDYVGITVDAMSNEISLHPKLLRELFPIDCTVLVGKRPLRITYQMVDEVLEVTLDGSDLLRPTKVTFLFTLQDGVAWEGATVLAAKTTLRIDFDSRKVFSYRGGEEFTLQRLQRLSGFSQRNVFTGLHFADEKLRQDTTKAVR